MYTKYPSDLPLITFAKELGISPIHFNGLDLTNCGITNAIKCPVHWTQTTFESNDYSSRDELSRVLYYAQLDIERELKTFIAPKETLGEIIQWPKLFRPELGNSPYPVFQTKWGNVHSFGTRTAVSVNAALNYLDRDNDGFAEIATSSIDLSTLEILVNEDINPHKFTFYYIDYANNLHWKIAPVIAYLGDGTLEIEIESYLLLTPDNINLSPFVKNRALNACGDIYIDDIAVVYEYNNPDDLGVQVEIFYKDTCNNDNCSYLSTTACATIINPHLGLFSLNNLNNPYINLNSIEYIKINYLSGLHTNYQLYQPYLEAVIYLAAARLSKVCTCSCNNDRIAELQIDMANRTDTAKYTLTNKILLNPFGTKMGEVLAYKSIGN